MANQAEVFKIFTIFFMREHFYSCLVAAYIPYMSDLLRPARAQKGVRGN